MPTTTCLSTDYLIHPNQQTLALFPDKRADRHGVISRGLLQNAVDSCLTQEGGFYDKAVVLMKAVDARAMMGVREAYYDDEEIKRWIKESRIRAFRRL